MAREFVTQAELEAAVEALREPGRFDAAERLVSQAAPGLQRLLVEALGSGSWNSEDDLREIDKALASSDPATARRDLLALLSEQTRIAMLVGATVGIELAGELGLHGDVPQLTVTHHTATEDPR